MKKISAEEPDRYVVRQTARVEESVPRPAPYNTEKLDVGTYYVWAVAIDRVGRKSLETRLGSFRVNESARRATRKSPGSPFADRQSTTTAPATASRSR